VSQSLFETPVAHTDRTRPDNLLRHAVRESEYRRLALVSLALSLLAITLLFKIPLGAPEARVDWAASSTTDPIEFSASRGVRATRMEGGIATTMDGPQPHRPASADEGAIIQTEDDQSKAIVAIPMQARETIFDHVESPPAIRGGLGAYYINIEYPPEAIERQIEGRLVLRFVVGTDGQASDVVVMKSLHPLCDSAAVQALRRTRFVVGRQNGEKVAVRMQLPVRFRLVGPGQQSEDGT
jgi:protein TonB